MVKAVTVKDLSTSDLMEELSLRINGLRERVKEKIIRLQNQDEDDDLWSDLNVCGFNVDVFSTDDLTETLSSLDTLFELLE